MFESNFKCCESLQKRFNKVWPKTSSKTSWENLGQSAMPPHPATTLMSKLLTGRRILVVEDEMLVLMETQDMLADLGCEAVIAAATNEQAIDLIETEQFDAVLLDLNLNGVRIFPVADALEARGIPLAFVTSYAGHSLRDSDRERPLLLKPFELASLETLLVGLLSAHGRKESK